MSRQRRISAVLIDLSGTVHIGSDAIEGAVEAISKLRANGIPFRFCSNTSKESTAAVKSRLTRMGLQLRSDATTSVEEVWTSIGAVKRALQVKNIKRPYLILSDSAKEELDTNSFQDVHCSYDAVVVGLAPSLFDYQHLNSAFRVLVGETHNDSGIKTDATAPKVAVPLIATHKAKYRESSDPPGLSLGPGPFVEALEFAAGVKAQILGKPTEQFFSAVIEDLRREAPDLSNDCIAIIGDDVEADLGDGAVKLGLWRVLVRTGKYRAGDECREGVTPPDETCDSLAAFVDAVIEKSFPCIT